MTTLSSGIQLNITPTMRGLNQYTKKLSDGALYLKISKAVNAVTDEMLYAVKARTPRASGETADNLYSEVYGTSVSELHGVVVSPDRHFAVLEYGRSVGATMPPEGPIIEWMHNVGIEPDSGYTGDERSLAFLIRRAIKRRGIPALHIMRTVIEEDFRHFPVVFMRTFISSWNDDQ